jgi:hypothetical protein
MAHHLGDTPHCGPSSGRLKQRHGVSIEGFKRSMTSSRPRSSPAAEDAMEFLSKLDKLKFGDKFSFLKNHVRMGEDFSLTLHDA